MILRYSKCLYIVFYKSFLFTVFLGWVVYITQRTFIANTNPRRLIGDHRIKYLCFIFHASCFITEIASQILVLPIRYQSVFHISSSSFSLLIYQPCISFQGTFGSDGWVRTNEMQESKSCALPLGDITIFDGAGSGI